MLGIMCADGLGDVIDVTDNRLCGPGELVHMQRQCPEEGGGGQEEGGGGRQ